MAISVSEDFGRLGLICTLAAGALVTDMAVAKADGIRPGEYDVTYWHDMPHLERYSMPRKTTFCVSADKILPIISGNGAFRACPQKDWSQTPRGLSYDIECPGRAGAKAAARYKLSTTGFTGRIAVKLGAKNMTLTEVQIGTRLGDCAPTQ